MAGKIFPRRQFNKDEIRLFTQLNFHIMPPDILALFTATHFQFITQAPGRQPTLYFEDAAGNMGRIRQVHERGPSLVYISAALNPTRVYFTQEMVDALENDPENTPNLVEEASLFPATGDHVWECIGPWDAVGGHYTNQHGSSGAIVMDQPMPVFNILDFANHIVRW